MSSAHSGALAGSGMARRDTRKRLQRIAVGAVELAPDAQVDAVVEVDRAPFVRPGPRVSPGSAAAGVLREPLPVDVPARAADLLRLDVAPAQRPGHRHAGLEVRVGVGSGRSRRSCRCRSMRPPVPVRASASRPGPVASAARSDRCRRRLTGRCRAAVRRRRRGRSSTTRCPRRCRSRCRDSPTAIVILRLRRPAPCWPAACRNRCRCRSRRCRDRTAPSCRSRRRLCRPGRFLLKMVRNANDRSVSAASVRPAMNQVSDSWSGCSPSAAGKSNWPSPGTNWNG